MTRSEDDNMTRCWEEQMTWCGRDDSSCRRPAPTEEGYKAWKNIGRLRESLEKALEERKESKRGWKSLEGRAQGQEKYQEKVWKNTKNRNTVPGRGG